MGELTMAMPAEMQALKARMRATWESGNYADFAKHLEPGALEFFDRLGVASGVSLLDIACGAGQLTIPAARRGIRVSAVDLAQNLVDRAKERAKQEGLDIDIRQGDAEALPYQDGSFDVVMSLIGAMFAPRPELVAAEMLRVCKPGGKIVMGNWTPEGFVGQMFKVVGKHVSPPGIPPPVLWGDEETVRARFGSGLSALDMKRHMYPLAFPFPPADVVDFFDTHYGPTVKARASLQGEAQSALRDEFIELWSKHNQASDGTTSVAAEYLVVQGVRA
jgi:SAM-dependent methyltransferase